MTDHNFVKNCCSILFKNIAKYHEYNQYDLLMIWSWCKKYFLTFQKIKLMIYIFFFHEVSYSWAIKVNGLQVNMFIFDEKKRDQSKVEANRDDTLVRIQRINLIFMILELRWISILRQWDDSSCDLWRH